MDDIRKSFCGFQSNKIVAFLSDIKVLILEDDNKNKNIIRHFELQSLSSPIKMLHNQNYIVILGNKHFY